MGLKPDLKVSHMPSELALNLQNLSRDYYDLADNRSAYVNKLMGELRMVFPQYLKIFSKVTTNTSLTLLENYTSPEALLAAPKDDIIRSIRSTARFGLTYATNKYTAIVQAAKYAKSFGHSVSSNFKRIRLYIRFIRTFDSEISVILSEMHKLVSENKTTYFVKQIHLIESYKGAGFLSAVSLMGEVGDFSAFRSPKQLFAYFGLDPAVKQSGKLEGTKISMSKRGSRIARRVLHTMALISISKNRNGSAKNPVLHDYYLKKCKSKPKLVALGVIMHKVCNIVFAMLRDEKEFTIITAEEHQTNYLKAKCDNAA